MGMFFSIPRPRSSDELHMDYASPERVQHLFRNRLYPTGIPERITQQVGARESDVLSVYMLENMLHAAFPHHIDSGALRQVAPVLYRIFLHHSAYPFKPSRKHGRESRLTAGGMATARALLTATDASYILFEKEEGHRIEHSWRAWDERCRLLFQSMIDMDWGLYQQQHRPQRAVRYADGSFSFDDRDDRDLAAVLDSIENHPKGFHDALKPVAAQLPSSWSMMEDGTVSVEDMLALLTILDIFLEVKRDCGSLSHPVWSIGLDDSIRSPEIMEQLKKDLASEQGVPNRNARKPSRDTLEELRKQLDNRNRALDWSTFNSMLAEYTPYFLRDLALLTIYLFPFGSYFSSDRAHEVLLPKPVADTFFRWRH